MDEGLDTGDILLQKSLTIAVNETGQTLHDRLAEIAPEAMLEALQLLVRGEAPREKQDEALATIAPKLKREAGQVDWSQPAEVIERKIRAFNPWPGSLTPVTIGSGPTRHLKVISAGVVDGKGKPGDLLPSSGSRLVVAAKEGAIELLEVQLEGKRRLSAAEFLRGLRGALVIAG
jgi:methionyl-tRNA formyltransferase